MAKNMNGQGKRVKWDIYESLLPSELKQEKIFIKILYLKKLTKDLNILNLGSFYVL